MKKTHDLGTEFKVGDELKVWGPIIKKGQMVSYGFGNEMKVHKSAKEEIGVNCYRLAITGYVHPRQCELVERAGPKVGDEVEITIEETPDTLVGYLIRGMPPRSKVKFPGVVVEVGD